MQKITIKKDVTYFPNYLDEEECKILLRDVEHIITEAPTYIPKMPKTGNSMSVQMTNCGEYGWFSDKEKGYRYEKFHPITNKKWPKIPSSILKVWQDLSGVKEDPDCCLVNIYNQNSKMGLHVDKGEKDFSYPVLSISLGASANFKIGGLKRSDSAISLKLNHGDVLTFGGESRLIYHGISKIYPNSYHQKRINLTLRKVY